MTNWDGRRSLRRGFVAREMAEGDVDWKRKNRVRQESDKADSWKRTRFVASELRGERAV